MTTELIHLAQQSAEAENLVYAPDEIALSWMNRFSNMVRINEREKCAQLCESIGAFDAAKKIRELSA